jgi:PrcB C-terminal
MKKIILLGLVVTLFSCSPSKVVDDPKSLYKILVSSDYGGAGFQFYEVITEQKEFNMLLGDEEIKKFVKPTDIQTSNFVLVNLGEKNSGGYKINIKSVTELSDKIIVDVEEIQPNGTAIQAITNPYCVLKINSKKPIEFK